MAWNRVQLYPLGGLNENENPHALRDDELALAINVARVGDRVGTRPGISRPSSGQDYETALAGENPIQRLYEYRKDFDEGRRLLAVSEAASGNDHIAYDDGNELDLTTNSVTLTPGQDNIWSFTTHGNVLYGAGAESSYSLLFWDGTVANPVDSVVIPDSAAATLQPKFVKSWRNYMLINGLVGGVLADNNPAATRYCDFATDPQTAANWAAGNTIGFDSSQVAGIDSFGKNYATGFGEYRDNEGDYLLLLSNNSLYSVLQDPQNDFVVSDAIANGCVHERAFIALGVDAGDAIYISNRGIHSLRQSQQFGAKADRFLSWKIRQTWATLNRARMSYIFGAYDFQNGRVVIAVATGSNTAADTLLVLDVKDQQELTSENARWSIWNLVGVNLNDLIMARDETSKWYLYGGTTTGDVVRFDENVFTDLDSAYPVTFQTKHQAYDSTLRRKRLGDVMVTLAPGGDYTPKMQVIFDYGARVSQEHALKMQRPTGFLLGTSVLGGSDLLGGGPTIRDARVYAAGAGRTIGFKFSHTGGAEPFWVSRIDHQVSATGEARGDTANA